jgi:predicted RNA polymerase sigma factor
MELREPGPYRLQAAIAPFRAEAVSVETTDRAQIAALHRSLVDRWSIVGRSVAVAGSPAG